MTMLTFSLIMIGIAAVHQISHESGPVSVTHEEVKGANGPAEHECDHCSDRD